MNVICGWIRMLTRLLADWFGEAKVRGGDPELPDCGAAVPYQVQATDGASIQDWYVQSSRYKRNIDFNPYAPS